MQLKLGNKLIARTITPYPAALECLTALGFEHQPDHDGTGEKMILDPLEENEAVMEAW